MAVAFIVFHVVFQLFLIECMRKNAYDLHIHCITDVHKCVCLHIVLGKAKANKANGNSDAPTIRMQFRLESIEARTNTHTHSIVCASVCVCVCVMANECYSYLQMDSRGASSI